MTTDEDEWEWPAKVRKKLHPRRNGVEAKFRKVMTPRKAFKTLADAYAEDHVSKSELAGPKASSAAKKLKAKVAKVAPDVGSPGEESALVRPFFSYAYGVELVDYWVGMESVSFALKALLATHRQTNYERAGWYKDTHCVETAWVRFRQRLATADEQDYADALALAETLWSDGPFQDRLRIAYAFPARPAWAHEVAKDYLAQPKKRRVECLYHSVKKPQVLQRVLERNIWWEPGIFFSFVEGAGAAACDALFPLLDADLKTPKRKIVYEALALIPSDAAMKAMILRADDRALIPFLTQASLRWPARAIRLLDATKGKSALLKTLLASVRRSVEA